MVGEAGDLERPSGARTPHPQFDAAEFATRIERLRARLRSAGVDVALFDEIEAMTWLSGYGNSENRWRCVGIPVEDEPFFLIRALDAGPCRERTWIDDVLTFRDWDDPMPVLAAPAAIPRPASGARIGLDFGSYCMPVGALRALARRRCRGRDFVDLGPVVAELRLIKSPAEIALLRRAAAIADEAMRRRRGVRAGGRIAARRAKVRRRPLRRARRRSRSARPDLRRARGGTSCMRHLARRPLAEGDVVHIEADAAGRGLQRAPDALRRRWGRHRRR